MKLENPVQTKIKPQKYISAVGLASSNGVPFNTLKYGRFLLKHPLFE